MLLALDLKDMHLNAGYDTVGRASDMLQASALEVKLHELFDVAIIDVNLARGTNSADIAAIMRQRGMSCRC